MKLKTIIQDSEIVLDGIAVETEWNDSSRTSVKFSDAKGNVVVVRSAYGFFVCKPAPPATVEKFALTGTIAGIPVSEMFDSKYDAELRRTNLAAVVCSNDDVKLDINKIDVPEAQ